MCNYTYIFEVFVKLISYQIIVTNLQGKRAELSITCWELKA